MKHISLTIGSLRGLLLVLALLVVVPTLAFSQTDVKYTNQKGGAEKAVRQTLDELYAALRSNDAAALDRIYADDYTFINESGDLTTKAARLAAIKSGDLKYESISFDDQALRVHGDTAIATYRVMFKAKTKGKDIGGEVRVTTTFVKMDGRWQLLAAQATPISE